MAWPLRELALLFATAAVIATVGFRDTSAQETTKRTGKALVHVHPEPLNPGDRLTDGEGGETCDAIEITSPTTLIWVDRMPDARFEHPTEYVLISAEGTRVVEGGWWPVLNGKPLFRGGERKSVEFPIALERK